MAEPFFEIRIRGVKQVRRALDRIRTNVPIRAAAGVTKACENTAKDIKNIFNGASMGFHDRTGSLRKSIAGGLKEVKLDMIVGFVSAGDDLPGSNDKPNKEYAEAVEFGYSTQTGEKYKYAGDTSYLRPGVLMASKDIAMTISRFLVPRRLLA